MKLARLLSASALITFAYSLASAQTVPPAPTSGPYKILNDLKVGGAGGFDYVYADADGRHLYIPRGNRVTVYDLDTLASAGEFPAAGVHGAVVDPKSGHGFSSSKPVVMWDAKTLATIKTIDVQGGPDGILFDPANQHVCILSHGSPNVTFIDSKDGAVVGTVDIDGAPEQGASDGAGHLYIDVEDKANVAVVDANTLKVTGHYDLQGKATTPAGLALDAKNHILFVCCRNPGMMVIMNANDGKIITTLPIGTGVDAAEFNPDTMEAFASTGDGILTVVKENSPTDFVVEQSLTTKQGAKTSTLDAKTGHILLITADRAAPPAAPAPTTAPAGDATPPARGRGRGGRGGATVPDSFQIIVAGK